MAVGGYGRKQLFPFSDIDLLFLRPYKQTAHVESVIEYMLYALWDLGFKVGHASRTIDECVKLSREDFTIRTSLVPTRPLSVESSRNASSRHGVPTPFTFRSVGEWIDVFAEHDLELEHVESYRPKWPTLMTYHHSVFVLVPGSWIG